VTALAQLRGRIAYWEKRIELEKTERRKQQLEVFAVAELARLIVREGMRAYGVVHSPTFAQVVEQEFRIIRQGQRVDMATSQMFEGSPPPTGSRRKKLKRPRARAAGARR
jgi:hypothetical protein